MKNKALMLAGLGLGSVLTLTAFSLVSANETTTTSTTATTRPMMAEKDGREGPGAFGGQKGEMRGGPMGGKMFGGPMKENDAVRAAITANDYAAFQTAIKDTPMAKKTVTQEQFAQMVAREQKHTAVEQALANNDYNAYIAATQPTQEEFTMMVAQHKSRQSVEAAVTAKDYTAFQAATKGTPMEGKVTQEQFNKMVTRQANK